MNLELLTKTPASVARLGSELFIKVPLFRTANAIRAFYINSALLQELFYFKEPLSWEQACDFIQTHFSVTLDEERGLGDPCGWGYVDKQADPSDIALSGNQGSGRAYYMGSCFNIKGEKTPLATSPTEALSNGILTMVDGIWSTIIANSLDGELAVGLSQVLAVVTIDEKTKAQLIRIDSNGSLDRISHCLYNKTPLSRVELLNTAKAFGTLEAEKFIHRILHGSWSAGNVSLQGHLIDFDSVCAVKGRQPQFSIGKYYPDNYFGFEYLGQLKILKTLIDTPEINYSKLDFDSVKTELEASLQHNIIAKLPYLMGFENDAAIAHNYRDKLQEIALLWLELSRYTRFESGSSLHAHLLPALVNHLFDFSAFFRIYPILKNSEQFSQDTGFYVLAYSPAEDNDSNRFQHSEFELEEFVMQAFKQYFMTEPEQLNPVKQRALQFITLYDELYQKIITDTATNPLQVAARAYVINEDRLYLLPPFALDSLIAKWYQKYSPKIVNRFMNTLISANRRTPQKNNEGLYTAEMRVYEEGYSKIMLDDSGNFQIIFSIYHEHLKFDSLGSENFSINFNQETFPVTINSTADVIYFISEKLAIQKLTVNFSRDDVFLVNKMTLNYQDTLIRLTNFYTIDDKQHYYHF